MLLPVYRMIHRPDVCAAAFSSENKWRHFLIFIEITTVSGIELMQFRFFDRSQESFFFNVPQFCCFYIQSSH